MILMKLFHIKDHFSFIIIYLYLITNYRIILNFTNLLFEDKYFTYINLFIHFMKNNFIELWNPRTGECYNYDREV